MEKPQEWNIDPRGGKRRIEDLHMAKIVEVFAGGRVAGQFSLDFRRSDFSEIPIETLLIYQQFLHAEGRSRKLGVYLHPDPGRESEAGRAGDPADAGKRRIRIRWCGAFDHSRMTRG